MSLRLTENNNCLRVETFEGSNYEIGKSVGKRFHNEIAEILSSHDGLPKTLKPYFESHEGKQNVENFLRVAKDTYPQYVEEMRGTAEGANVDFIDILLLNMESEICTLLGDTDSLGVRDAGCSSVLVNTPDVASFVHSEDQSPQYSKYAFVGRYRVIGGDGNLVEDFTCIMLPGHLPGHTVGFTHHGLALGLNTLFQRNINMTGMPRRFTTRAMYGASSIDNLAEIISRKPGPSYGFNINAAQTVGGKVQMTSFEVIGCPEKGGRITEHVTNDKYYHTNLYKHSNVDFFTEPSSPARDKVLSNFLTHTTIVCHKDVVSIFGDTSNKEYPMYRNGDAPDYLATAAIVAFNMKLGIAEFYCNNPKNNKPFYVEALR